MTQVTLLKETDLNALSLLFTALSNDCRIRILNILRIGPKNVSQISESLRTEQTVISHNLKCLTFCGLVTVEQLGKSRIYALNKETVEPILVSADKHVSKYASNLRTCESLER